MFFENTEGFKSIFFLILMIAYGVAGYYLKVPITIKLYQFILCCMGIALMGMIYEIFYNKIKF